MRSADIKPLRGPYAALLWEQWRLTRPVLLLPVVIAIADLGLYAWCSYAFGMRDDDFVDFAAAYIMLLLFLTLMLMLCHPDRRLEMRLVLTPRLLRLPVRPAALLLSSLPLRTVLSGIAVYAAFWLHHLMFPQEIESAVAGMVTAGFLIGFLLLYTVTTIAGVWGDRATGAGILIGLISIFWVGGSIGQWELVFTPEAWYPMWLGVFVSFGLALGGGFLSHALRRRLRGGVAWRLALPRSRAMQGVRDIPLFDSPLAAQRWYENRRVGWALPTLGFLLSVAVFSLLVGDQVKQGLPDMYLTNTFWYPLALFPACAVLVALATALFDYYLFRRPEGRFLMVRPVHADIFARARMRVQVASVVKTILIMVTTVIVLNCLIIFVKPGFLLIPDLASIYPVQLGEVTFIDLLKGLAYMAVPLGAWCVAFLVNRITFACILGGAATAMVLSPFELEPFDVLAFRITVAAVFAAMIWSLWVGLRVGLLRPWPILGLLILLPLSSIVALAEKTSNTDTIWSFAAAVAFPLLCVAGAPIGYHLRRSNTLWPRALDVATERSREWRMALKRVGVVSVGVLLVLGLVHLALARVASQFFEVARREVADIPLNKRPANFALLEEAVAIGHELSEIIDAMPEACPDRVVLGTLPRPSYWVWCNRQMEATGAKLEEAVKRITHAQEHPSNTSFTPGQRPTALKGIPYFQGADYSELFLTIRGLLSGAYQKARDHRPDEALRYMEAYLYLVEACNAAPYPNDPQGLIGHPLGWPFNDIMNKAELSAMQLARVSELLPRPANPEALVETYNLTIEDAASYPLGHGGYLDSILVSSAWRFWYSVLAISRMDQILLAQLIQEQARSLQDTPVHRMDNSELSSQRSRLALQFPDSERLRLSQFTMTQSNLLLIRISLAVRRFAAEHDGSLPENLRQPSLTPYLNPDDIKILSRVDYRIESADKAQLNVTGGPRLELGFPKRALEQDPSDT